MVSLLPYCPKGDGDSVHHDPAAKAFALERGICQNPCKDDCMPPKISDDPPRDG